MTDQQTNPGDNSQS